MNSDDDIPKARTPLSRKRILKAAIKFADENGLDALSMRKLAKELGFEVMALYNHVKKKDDLLDGALDLVIGEISNPPGDLDWKASILYRAKSTHSVLLTHRWAAQIWTARKPGPYRLQFMEAMLTDLKNAGFSDEIVYRGFHCINIFILGFTTEQLNFNLTPEQLNKEASAFIANFSKDEYPNLIKHIQQHLDEPKHKNCHDEEFDFGLNLILSGLEKA